MSDGLNVARRIAINAALQAGGEIVGKVATLALTVVAARELSRDAFGAFAYALAFAPLVGVVWSWGLGVLFIQEASESPDELPRLYGEFILLKVFLTIPTVVVFGVVGALFRPDRGSAVVLIAVLVAWAINSFREANVSAGIARQQMVGVTLAQVVDRISSAALGIGVLLLGMGVVALSIGFLAGSLAGYVAARVAVRRLGIHLDLRAVQVKNLFPMLKRSFYIGIDNMVSSLLFRVDALLLAAFKGDAALAAYSVAYRLLETVMFVSWAVTRALFPAMSAGGPQRVRKGLEEGIAGIAILYIPFGVALVIEADRLIPFIFGGNYGDASATAAQWLAAAPLFLGMSYLAGYGLQSLARPRAVFLASLYAAVFNLALNLVLIPRYSGTGAAIATTSAYALETVVSLWMLRPDIGWPRLGRRLAAPMLASAIMAAVIILLPGHVAVVLVAGAAVYFATWLSVARRLNPEQVTLLRSLLPGRR
ncbi:MAG TPA: flippase [Actinomycetota bacterium]|jgi:O-antigen/teichoic acid export membrane protein